LPTATRLSLLRWYYLATPLFWLVGVIWGVNVRVAFLDDFPVGRNVYYLFCFVLGIAMVRAPTYVSRLAFAESAANIGLLILSVAVWYLRMLDWAAGPSVAVRAVTPAELVSFVLTAVVAGVSYRLRGSGTRAGTGASIIS